MTDRKKTAYGLVLSIGAVILMTLVEKVLAPSYAVKSLLKVLCFAGSILLYCVIFHEDVKNVIFLYRKKLPKLIYILMIGTYLFMIGAYFLFKDKIDLSSIRESLFEKEGLSRDNFLFIFSYIILVNSFLEEAFFRGFILHIFRGKSGSLFSAFLFSLYHIGIMSSWFHPLIFVICILGLMVAGLFLEEIKKRSGTLLGNWIVHGFANLAINTIATFMILGL